MLEFLTEKDQIGVSSPEKDQIGRLIISTFFLTVQATDPA